MKKISLRLLQIFTIFKYIMFKLFSFTFKNKYSDVWLISERGDEARDNAYAFYKYIKEYHPEINIKYVISKNSYDIKNIKKEDIVYLRSSMHFKLYISAKYLISTHIMGFSPEFRSFSKLIKKMAFFDASGKKVFLQHGITKDYIPELRYENTKLDLFICGAKPEYEYIKNEFGYNDNQVKYTGFARYDYLENKNSNCILFMPTWRKSIFYINDLNEFKKTEYYTKINELLKNEKLHNYLKSNNLKLIFYPHYEIQNYIDAFYKNDVVVLANKEDYNISELLKECKMLITDYSSTFFDVSYMKKKVIYYQFDYNEFRKNHYNAGYFDYRKDGFGPVYEKSIDVVDDITNYGLNLDKMYIEKINEFFVKNDKNNCQRIYEEIIKL